MKRDDCREAILRFLMEELQREILENGGGLSRDKQ